MHLSLQSLGSDWVASQREVFWCSIFILSSIYLAIRCYLKIRRLGRLSVAPAVPSSDPFGSISAIFDAAQHIRSNSFVDWSRNVLEVPGHTVELRVLGLRMILTDNPDNIKAIFSTNFSSFGKGETARKVWGDLMLGSVFCTDGPVWHANKNYLREHISKIRSSDYEITEKHLANFIQTVSDGRAHDCLDLADRLSIDTVTEVFFGESSETLLAGQQPIRSAVEKMYATNTHRHLYGDLGPWLPGNKAASKVLQDYLDSIIDKASGWKLGPDSPEKSRKEQTLLGSLVARQTPRKLIKDQMMAILLGGKDPAAITITWALYALARNPHMVAKLRSEIESTCGLASPPEPRDLKNMPYLHSVVQETLRIYHPLGFNARTALNDTFLPTGGGADGKCRVDIPKGTHTILSIATLHRRHDLIGPDADMFNPDRWQNWKPQTWEFVPFNHGPRICLGRNFAYMQMEYVLCRLFQVFQMVELDRGHDGQAEMKIKLALNTKPAKPVMIRFLK